MELEEIFPTRLANALKRGRIETLEELKREFDSIPKDFAKGHFRDAGKQSYEMI